MHHPDSILENRQRRPHIELGRHTVLRHLRRFPRRFEEGEEGLLSLRRVRAVSWMLGFYTHHISQRSAFIRRN